MTLITMAIATWMSMSSGLSAGHLDEPKRVSFWFEVDNPIVRPGESVTVTWWCSYDPPSGSAVTYNGNDATVLFFQGGLFDLVVQGNTPGDILGYYSNQEMCYNDFPGKIVENGIIGISIVNFYKSQCPLKKGTKENPLWIYSYTWKPKVYKYDVVTLNLLTFPTSTVALEVPAMNYIYPKFIPDKWDNSIAPKTITITDQTCFADCDWNDVLDIDDFICFQTAYSLNDLTKADCDGDGTLLIDDFICFQTQFVLGC